MEEHHRLSRTLGVLYLGHGSPFVEDMKDGLAALSEEFGSFNWVIYEYGNKFLTYFPTEATLSFAASKTSVPCRDYRAKFRVCRWNRDEDDKFYSFPIVAWIEIKGLPLHHWNRVDMSNLLVKFAHIIYAEIVRLSAGNRKSFTWKRVGHTLGTGKESVKQSVHDKRQYIKHHFEARSHSSFEVGGGKDPSKKTSWVEGHLPSPVDM